MVHLFLTIPTRLSLFRIEGHPVKFVVAVALSAFVADFAAAADPAPELRYQWKAGQSYMYAVTIEADYGDYWEILTGHPVFDVKAADQDGIKMTFRGGLAEKQQLKPDKKGLLRPRSPFSPFTAVGAVRPLELAINTRGETISSKGSAQLPFLLGDLSTLMIEPLPKGADQTWKTSVPLNLVKGGLPRSPFPRADDRTQIKATLETTFAVGKVTPEAVEITRTVTMATAETVGGEPRIGLEGKGTLTFDRKLGCFTSGEFTQKIVARDDKTTTETPIRFSYRLMTDAEKTALAKTADGSLLFPGEPLSEALQQQALDDLKSGAPVRVSKALNLLQSKEPPAADKEPTKLRVEIAKALEDLLTGTEKTRHFSSAKALINWGTKGSIPTLIKNVDSPDTLPRIYAMEALGKMKATDAAEPISKRLAQTSDRDKARDALVAIGPKAEPAVLKLADHPEWQVRNEVCNILAAIGTEKSVAALTTLQSDSQALVKNNAKKALEAVNKRK